MNEEKKNKIRVLDDYFNDASDKSYGNASNPEYATKLTVLMTLLSESPSRKIEPLVGDVSDFHPAWDLFTSYFNDRDFCAFQFSVEMDADGKPWRVLSGAWFENGDWDSLWSVDPHASYTVLVQKSP